MGDAHDRRMRIVQQNLNSDNFPRIEELWNYVAGFRLKKARETYNFNEDYYSYTKVKRRCHILRRQGVAGLGRIVKDDNELKYFFDHHAYFLSGSNYVAVREEGSCVEIGRGAYGVIILARDIEDNQYVAIKTCSVDDFNTATKSLLREYMFQWRAHKALENLCPRPKGLLIRKAKTKNNGILPYILVSEFVSLLPGLDMSMNLDVALELAETSQSVLLKQDFLDISMSLIHATNILQTNKICHVDLRPANVMIQFHSDVSIVSCIL